ncbi:YdcF family protein [Sporosarcina sp. ITBMC105]
MKNKKKLGIFIGMVVTISGLVFWLWPGKLMVDALKPEADGSKPYAIILGAKVNGKTPSLSLRYRLESAVAYAHAHPHVTFILSGGQGPDEDISEAEAMWNYMVEHGIDEDRLVLESTSTSTYENLVNTKKLLPEGVHEVTIITSDYHIARARMIAKKLDLETDVVAAKTPASVKAQQQFRERLALIKTKIVGK